MASGSYAIAVLHDENENFKMDTSIIGIPKEGYGVSNNVKGRFGPPKFADARFRVTEASSMTIRIELIYH
ncbi:hypothetical protein D3C83_126870 [compost metagenome]